MQLHTQICPVRHTYLALFTGSYCIHPHTHPELSASELATTRNATTRITRNYIDGLRLAERRFRWKAGAAPIQNVKMEREELHFFPSPTAQRSTTHTSREVTGNASLHEISPGVRLVLECSIRVIVLWNVLAPHVEPQMNLITSLTRVFLRTRRRGGDLPLPWSPFCVFLLPWSPHPCTK